MQSEEIEECRLLQEQEREIIESIYPDYTSNDFSSETILLEVPIEFSTPRTVEITDGSSHETVSLKSLPSIALQMSFPPTYPQKDPPHLVSVRSTHMWIPQISRLRSALEGMWTPGETVLYDWIEFIHKGDVLDALNLISGKDIISISHSSPPLLRDLLVMYEENATSAQFSRNSYQCTICFEYQKGSKCTLLTCGHIFCTACLEDFWGLCIKEGDITKVGCPDQECVKVKRSASEQEVSRVVTEEELLRWRWLIDKATTDKDPSIIHCPIPSCQRPVVAPSVTPGEESAWDRLRTCQGCGFSFCSFCRRAWHGTLNNCPISVSEKLVLEYLALPLDSHERTAMERRFGKANVLKLIENYEQERQTNKLIDDSTTACPGCRVRVEKSLGCNHMTCVKCGNHFCFRCGKRLDPRNPYVHFSTPFIPCYQKLFDGQTGAEDGFVEIGFDDLN